MTKTEKAETAAEDATGITTANVEPATDSSPADTEIESPAPPTIPEISTDEPYFWRKITDEDVCSAICGTYLYSIVFDLAKNYKGDIPFQLILHQALSVFLPALTHRMDEDGEKPENQELPDNISLAEVENALPAHLSRLYIDTIYGNVPNIYTLVIAPSGAGKGIGPFPVLDALGYKTLNKASLEGVVEAAIINPHIFIRLDEFGSVLDGNGYMDAFRKGLTDLFNGGKYEGALSSRKGSVARKVAWIYPSVYAAIQPDVLNACGRALDVSQGLLARFLICFMSEKDMNYEVNLDNPDVRTDILRIMSGLKKVSTLRGSVKVPDPNYNTVFLAPLKGILDERLRPLADRYANEYLPRLALALSILVGENGAPDITEGGTPVLNEEHFRRASVILYRDLAMAEAAFGALTDLEGSDRIRENDIRKMVRMLSRMNPDEDVTIASISHKSNGTGWNSKRREELLNELADRGIVSISYNGQKLERVRRGCVIKLNADKIPPGM